MADQLLGATNKMNGVAHFANGNFVATGEAAVVTLGFRPRHVIVYNVTTATRLEKIDGMAAATTIKTVTAGTQTSASGSLIVITNDGFTIATAELAPSDVVAWMVSGG